MKIIKNLPKDSKDLAGQQQQRLDVVQAKVKNEHRTGTARTKQLGQRRSQDISAPARELSLPQQKESKQPTRRHRRPLGARSQGGTAPVHAAAETKSLVGSSRNLVDKTTGP